MQNNKQKYEKLLYLFCLINWNSLILIINQHTQDTQFRRYCNKTTHTNTINLLQQLNIPMYEIIQSPSF
jgi:hypothetical protein